MPLKKKNPPKSDERETDMQASENLDKMSSKTVRNEKITVMPRKTRSQDKPTSTEPMETASSVVVKPPSDVNDVDAPTIDHNDPVNKAAYNIHCLFPGITLTKSM